MKFFDKNLKELKEQNEKLISELRRKNFDNEMAINKICLLERQFEKSREEATKYKDLYLQQISINIQLIEKGGGDNVSFK